jgi:hypothetical protein
MVNVWIWISIQNRDRIKSVKTSEFRKADVYFEGLEVFQWSLKAMTEDETMFNFSRYHGFLHKFCLKQPESGTERKIPGSRPGQNERG